MKSDEKKTHFKKRYILLLLLCCVIDSTFCQKRQIKEEEMKPAEAIDFNMVPIEGGTYSINDRLSIKVPSYKMSKYEVTQAQWRSVMGSNPSYFKGCEQCPVEQVSWDDIQIFIQTLNKKENTNYRLPTHPEWYYAVRGGSMREGLRYNLDSEGIKEIAWCSQNSEKKAHVVGEKKANELGLHDLNGNVWEWVADVWPDDYDKGIRSAHNRAADKSDKILLGGSWTTSAHDFYMIWYSPQFTEKNFRSSNLGFRLAR